MQVHEAQQAFLNALEGEVAATTVSWYGHRIARLAGWLGEREIGSVTIADLRSYRAQLLNEASPWETHPNRSASAGNFSIYTVHGHIRALRRFFSWLVAEGLLDSSPAQRLGLPRLPAEPPKAISQADFRRLLTAAGQSGTRDLAIVLFLADTGCRVAGLVGLRCAELDLVGRRAAVTEKGQKMRIVFFGEMTAAALSAWLGERPDCAHDAVFVNLRRTTPISVSGVQQILRRLGEAAGVHGRCNPHAFRHAAARGWLENGADLATVAQLLGHTSVVVTAKFYARWAGDELQARHDRFTWLDPGDTTQE